MRQYSLFPYQKTSQGLAVLMTDPRNIFALNDLEALLEQAIEPVMADRLEIEKLIDAAFSTLVTLENIEPIPETPEATIRRYIREELEIFRRQLLLDLR